MDTSISTNAYIRFKDELRKFLHSVRSKHYKSETNISRLLKVSKDEFYYFTMHNQENEKLVNNAISYFRDNIYFLGVNGTHLRNIAIQKQDI